MHDMRTEAEIMRLHDECEQFLAGLRGRGIKFGGMLRDTALISSTLEWVLEASDEPDVVVSSAVAPDTEKPVASYQQVEPDVIVGELEAVSCPYCDARKGEPCRGTSNSLHHYARAEEARRWMSLEGDR